MVALMAVARVLSFHLLLTAFSAVHADYTILKSECPSSSFGKPRGGHDRWRDCEDCHSYKIVTSSGAIETYTCPSGLTWNWKLDTPNCDLIDECDDCITTCDGRLNDTGRIWRHCTDCTKYVTCTSQNGLVENECPQGFFWDWKLRACSANNESCEKMTHMCGDDCDFNTDGEIMFQPDCVYCNVYRTCFGTLANRHVCSEGLAFSLATKSCDRVDNVDCGGRVMLPPYRPATG